VPSIGVYNVAGEQVGELNLNEEIFGIEPHVPVLHQAVVRYLAGKRRGTHDTKTRAEVRGGGRKPWRQKGTGRARHGSIRSPIWRKGGIVFGPHPRDYAFPMPRKMRRLALRSALAAKLRKGQVTVLDRLELPEVRTREMKRMLDNLEVTGSALVVTSEPDDNVRRATRNIPRVKYTPVAGLTVYDVLAHERLIITREALSRVEEALA
jgi:large subunit ribosomal protein L4